MGLPRRATNLEGLFGPVGNDLRHRRIPVNDSDRAATPYPTQVLAQVCLQIRDPDLAHDLIMVMTSHNVKAWPEAQARGSATTSALVASTGASRFKPLP
jgi:hypothetical protein